MHFELEENNIVILITDSEYKIDDKIYETCVWYVDEICDRIDIKREEIVKIIERCNGEICDNLTGFFDRIYFKSNEDFEKFSNMLDPYLVINKLIE